MKTKEKIAKIEQRLDYLLEHQKKFQSAIERLQQELIDLKQELKIEEEIVPETLPVQNISTATSSPIVEASTNTPPLVTSSVVADVPIKEETAEPRQAFNLEEYIGGNLINKIGIVILLIGLSLFVKFAIDKGLMPPFVRVMLGYLAGLTLVGIAWRLKQKHLTYSAVLFSGGMATLYFTSYLAHTFFDPAVLPRMFSFALMELFTIINIGVAYKYRQQVIGLIGLVGAYAIPFLLSDNSGSAALLFAYMSIINIGVLILAAFRDWRIMTYMAIGASWIIFLSWMLEEYRPTTDLLTAWLFNTLFFLLFYATLIAYQFLNKVRFSRLNIVFIVINAFLFYLLGLWLLIDTSNDHWLGAFTLLSGLIHLGVGYVMYRQLEMQQPLLVLSTLFVFFFTLAITIQFKSTSICLLFWTMETVALFILAYRLGYRWYRILSFIVLGVVLLTLLIDWSGSYYDQSESFKNIINSHFLNSFLVVAAVAGMNWWHRQKTQETKKSTNSSLKTFLSVLLGGLLFFTFLNEILHYCKVFQNITTFGNSNLNGMQIVFLFNYTFVFLISLAWLNAKKLHYKALYSFIVVATIVSILTFLSGAIPELNNFRDLYRAGTLSSPYFLLRYLSYILVGGLLYTVHLLLPKIENYHKAKAYYPLFYHFVILAILSIELTTFLQLATDASMESLAHKVGYSILWGAYSLFMVGLGFWKNNKLLRIAGIALFGITLIKVFFFDLQSISTVSKTIVFIALGVLLLIISYLYQRFER